MSSNGNGNGGGVNTATIITSAPEDAQRIEVVHMLEQLLATARAGKIRDFAYVGTLDEDPNKYVWGVTPSAHSGRILMFLSLLKHRLATKLIL